jgi:hypothetical protein
MAWSAGQILTAADLNTYLPQEPTTWETPIAGGITTTSGTTTANYVTVGALVYAEFRFVLGASSAITGDVSLTLPVAALTTAAPVGQGYVRDASVGTRYHVLCHTLGAATVLVRPMDVSAVYPVISAAALSSTVPFTWTTGDEINVGISYLAA